MRRYTRFLLFLGGSVMIAACSTSPLVVPRMVDETEPLLLSARNMARPATVAVFPRPGLKPSVPPKSGRSRSDDRKVIKLGDDTLLGLSEREVAILLGPAAATLESPPSKVLQYRFPGCDLKLFLYANLQTGDYAVLHLETHPGAAKTGTGAVCTAMISRPLKPERML